MIRRIVVSPRAEIHLETLHQRVTLASGTLRADLTVARLLKACRKLDLFPQRGIARDDLYPGLRVMGYRRQASIAFTIEAETVTIQGVFWRGWDIEASFND